MVSARTFIVACVFGLSGAAEAAVTATVDRNEIEFNESLNLTISSDDIAPIDPDIRVVEQDFDILGQNHSQNTTIVNGRISQTRSWIFSLMPKRQGELTIPPIAVGNESTEPLKITVAKVAPSDIGEADVIVVAELDRDETWVQAQVVYTIKILTAVAPRQPRLDEPKISGGEVLIQQLGDDTRYESVIDGRRYAVVERRYALFPQQSGDLEIAEALYSARLWERSRLSARKLFRSEKLKLTVQPIPAPPPAFPDAAWLPASQLLLTERWSPESLQVAAGEPLTRAVRVAAVGLLSNQLPEIPGFGAPGVRIYPDQPELETTDSDDGVVGFRTERYAIIAADAGEYPVAELAVPWWNVTTGQWETATLPEVSLTVMPTTPLVDAAAENGAVGSDEAEPVNESVNVWRTISMALAAGWAITLAAFIWLRRQPKPARALPATLPGYRRTRRLVREARSAALANEPRQAAERLLEWAATNWPDSPTRSLDEVAQRVPEPLRAAIDGLHAALYGNSSEPWQGETLAQSLSTLTDLPRPKNVSREDTLAPLTP